MTGDSKTINMPGALESLAQLREFNKMREVIADQQALIDKAEDALRSAIAREQLQVSRIADLERVAADRESLAAQLRDMKRDADPERLERAKAEAVSVATYELSKRIADLEGKVDHLERVAAELRASKRKLREALERAKEKK